MMGDDEGVGQPVAQEDIAGDRHAIEDLAVADGGEVVGRQSQPAAHRRAPVLGTKGLEVERNARQGHDVHVEHCFDAKEAVHPAAVGRSAGPAQPVDEVLPTDGAAEPPLQAASLGRGQAAAAFRLVQHPESAGRLCVGVVVRALRLFPVEGQVNARVRRPQPHGPRVEVHLLHERQDDLVFARRRRATELVFEPPAVVDPDLDPPQLRLAGFDRLPERGLSCQEHGAFHRGRAFPQLVAGLAVLLPALEQAPGPRRPESTEEALACARAFQPLEGPALCLGEQRLHFREPLLVEVRQPRLRPPAALGFGWCRGGREQRCRDEERRCDRADAAAPGKELSRTGRASTPAGAP